MTAGDIGLLFFSRVVGVSCSDGVDVETGTRMQSFHSVTEELSGLNNNEHHFYVEIGGKPLIPQSMMLHVGASHKAPHHLRNRLRLSHFVTS